MTEAVDPIISQLIMWLGLPGTVLVVLVFASVKFGWVKVTLPALRRKDDQVLEMMMTIVKENTSAFIALKGTMDDSKGITVQVSQSLSKVQEALATLTGHVHGAMQAVHDGGQGHHREARGGR